MSTNPLISGIICTHNREQFLERCIKSMLEQTLAEALYEIVVVDNGSTDSTRSICEQYRSLSNFTYVFEPVLGLSSARNTGWQQARGRYVGYLDDDAWAEETWFEKALWCFEEVKPMPDWVGGPIELEWEVDAPTWITREYETTLGFINWGPNHRFLTDAGERLGGGNSFYPKKLLEKMEGFDTRLGRKKNLLLSGEETQFQHRLKALDGRLYYHPGVKIHHYVGKERTDPGFFYKRYYWGGITDYIMSRTLQNVSFEHISQENSSGSRIGRFLSHGFSSVWPFRSEDKKVQSRIYLSYVMGQLVALIKYRGRAGRLELKS